MSSRRKSREFALQMLFQAEVNDDSPEEIRSTFWNVHHADPETRRFADDLFKGTLDSRSEVDERISRHSRRWRLGRMAGVDRNVLRMAIAEMVQTQTPRKVVIDEAIEIARRYSTEESAEFVNGVLDAVLKELEEESQKVESLESQVEGLQL